MNFKSILDKIFAKINEETDLKKRSREYKLLESKLIENEVFKHQLELLSILKEGKKRIKTESQLSKIVSTIRNKNFTFISENKLTPLSIWKENKTLLEYYNINPKEIVPNIVDKLIDVNTTKVLSEKSIRTYIGEVSQRDKKEEKRIIKESFRTLLEKKSTKDLNKQFKIVGFLASGLDSKNKDFVYESLRKLRSMQKSNYKECITKLHKLRLISEKLIREYQKDSSKGPKRVSLKDLKYIKSIQIEALKTAQDPEKIFMSFQIPFYPIGAFFNELRISAIDIKKRLDRLETPFINDYIRKYPQLFSPKGLIWQVIMRVNGVQAGNAINGRVKVWLNAKTGEGNTFEEYYSALYSILKEFNNTLPETFPDELTDKAQKAALKQRDPNRIRAKRITNPIDPIEKAKRSKARKSKSIDSNEGFFNSDDEFGGMF